jgi:2-polyprenyl-3-methyl-5-hydroxy-6-metoxy-1,4-benzoquinol methylase
MIDDAIIIRDWKKALEGDYSVCENWGAHAEVEEHLARYVCASERIKRGIVLDVPCGSGYGTALLSEKSMTVGIDIDGDKIALCHELYPFGIYFEADMMETTFSDGRFSSIVSLEGIEHVNNTDGFLREIKRLLDDDGVFLCSTPNKAMHGLGDPKSGHKHVWHKDEFKEILERHFGNVVVDEQKSSRGVTGWLAECRK